MLAVIYLFVMITLGDAICRRFYSFVSLPHRLAAAFLTGLLFSTWATYLLGLLFARSAQPLFWSNLIYFVSAVGIILWLRQRKTPTEKDASLPASANEANRWDWFLIGCFIIFASWQMFGTYNMSGGKLQIHNHQWSDFGPNLALSQSFALGHNFPTEYPHFSGERIHYHFLYYFQIGNLEYLGFNPAFSNNILSILSLVSMLILVMSLGVVLFNSRVAGRIGAILFFFHGTLSYIPFILSHDSLSSFINKILTMREFLPSGFPYHGELWGVWSQVVFVNQRHFSSSIGLLLLVLTFLFIRYRAASTNNQSSEEKAVDDSTKTNWLKENLPIYAPFIFSGVILGLGPLWNSATFVSAFAILALLFFLFPLKKQMIALGVITAIFALPQIMFLRGGDLRPTGYSLFHWGYIVDKPTLWNIVEYLGFTFGFKWALLGLALYFATWFERRVFIAVSSLFALTFFFKFSDEVLTNHKFLNIWLVFINVFVGYGLWRLWNSRDWLKSELPGKILAVVLFILIVISGLIDLFPFRNGYWMEMTFQNDRLVNWLRTETDPKGIFLSPRYVNHQIFLAGRRVFYGHPYYAWGAGYRTDQRDIVYRKMFETQNPAEMMKLLSENNISYVAIDNGLRNDSFIRKLNEPLYQRYFDKVFIDEENIYNSLTIYKIPANLTDLTPENASASDLTNTDESLPAVKAFEGGGGKGRGQFTKPRGIGIDANGNFYVADAGNSRVQKFSSEGDFLAVIGTRGTGAGELRAPRGIVVDAAGDIYLTDEQNNRLMKFKADGTFVKEWRGIEPDGFFAPRDLAIAANKQLYILDTGKGRVVKFDPESEEFTVWKEGQTDEGDFTSVTGLTAAGDRLYIADNKNNRVSIFDFEGKFVGKLDVPQWDKYIYHYPDIAVDEKAKEIYVTSGWSNEVLIFNMDGELLRSMKPTPPGTFNNISSIAFSDTKAGRRLYVLNTGSDVIDTGNPSVSHFELENKKQQ